MLLEMSALLNLFFPLLSLLIQCSSNPTPCIPVMGFGYNEDSHNFVPRLLSSIDFCVDHLVIVVPQRMKDHLEEISGRAAFGNLSIEPAFIGRQFIGVAETWNVILRKYPAVPWYLICAYDVMFLRGQLDMFSHRFWARSGGVTPGSVVSANFAHTRWLNMQGGKGFNLFGMSRDVVEHVGYFDENIYPAFWEDRDYLFRLRLWNGSLIRTFGDIRPIHGLFADKNGVEYSHSVVECLLETIGSSKQEMDECHQGIQDSIRYVSGTKYLHNKRHKQLIGRGDKANFRYVVQKWGCDPILSKRFYNLINCNYSSPFNSGKDISFWVKNEQNESIFL